MYSNCGGDNIREVPEVFSNFSSNEGIANRDEISPAFHPEQNSGDENENIERENNVLPGLTNDNSPANNFISEIQQPFIVQECPISTQLSPRESTQILNFLSDGASMPLSKLQTKLLPNSSKTLPAPAKSNGKFGPNKRNETIRKENLSKVNSESFPSLVSSSLESAKLKQKAPLSTTNSKFSNVRSSTVITPRKGSVSGSSSKPLSAMKRSASTSEQLTTKAPSSSSDRKFTKVVDGNSRPVTTAGSKKKVDSKVSAREPRMNGGPIDVRCIKNPGNDRVQTMPDVNGSNNCEVRPSYTDLLSANDTGEDGANLPGSVKLSQLFGGIF